jgi:cobalt-zinc-cadmium efflux system outer membrane protein
VRSFLLSMIVFSSGLAAAEAIPALDEAQLLARIDGDPRLARIAAAADAARVEVSTARLRADPSLSLEREEVFPDAGLATNYVRLTIPLSISGARGARIDAATAEVRAVIVEGEGTRFAMTIEALTLFRRASFERARVELLRGERAALVKAVEVVRERTSAGTASGYDLQRIEIELATYDDQIAAAETELSTARSALGALVGEPAVDAIAPSDIPADPPALDALLANLVVNHPDYRAASERLDGAKHLERAASRSRVPDLALTGGFIAQDIDATTSARGYTAGLSLTVPVFDRGRTDRAKALAVRKAADAERAHLARHVPATVRARHSSLARTIARARTLQTDQLARLAQLLTSAETAYRDGGGDIVELLDAYSTARDARLRDLQVRRDARIAELELWLALGRRP